MTQTDVDPPRRHSRACPLCAGPTDRVARRWWHRLLSWWLPVKRFQCRSLACGWDGVLHGPPGRGPWRRKATQHRPVLQPSRLGPTSSVRWRTDAGLAPLYKADREREKTDPAFTSLSRTPS
jgi:hypothetical protein